AWSPTTVSGGRSGNSFNARSRAATTSVGPKSPPIASTAIRPASPAGLSIRGRDRTEASGGAPRSDGHVEHLAAAVHPVIRVDAVGTENGAVRRVPGDLGSLEGIGCAAMRAAALRLLAFRLGHDGRMLKVRGRGAFDACHRAKGERVKGGQIGRQAITRLLPMVRHRSPIIDA